MKKVNRKTFLELPDGIAFAKFIEGEEKIAMDNYEGLCIKVKTYRYDEDDVDGDYKKGDGFDFGTMQLSETKTFSRDGLFEEEQMFAVFEDEDIDIIIEYLQSAKGKQT